MRCIITGNNQNQLANYEETKKMAPNTPTARAKEDTQLSMFNLKMACSIPANNMTLFNNHYYAKAGYGSTEVFKLCTELQSYRL